MILSLLIVVRAPGRVRGFSSTPRWVSTVTGGSAAPTTRLGVPSRPRRPPLTTRLAAAADTVGGTRSNALVAVFSYKLVLDITPSPPTHPPILSLNRAAKPSTSRLHAVVSIAELGESKTTSYPFLFVNSSPISTLVLFALCVQLIRRPSFSTMRASTQGGRMNSPPNPHTATLSPHGLDP
jgi:hypothetical protein